MRLARDVIGLIPEFLDLPGVLGIGEIGLNKNTRNESIIFFEHVELADRPSSRFSSTRPISKTNTRARG